MIAANAPRRRVRVARRPVTLWEDPARRFRCTPEAVDQYAFEGRWELAFNALVLMASPLRPEALAAD